MSCLIFSHPRDFKREFCSASSKPTPFTTLAALFCNACSLFSSVWPQFLQTVLQYLKYGSASVQYTIIKDSFGTQLLMCFVTPIFLFIFFEIWSICNSHDKLASTIIPRYFVQFVRVIRWSSTLIAIRPSNVLILWFDRDIINSVSTAFRLSLFAFNQSKIFCKLGITYSL